MLTVPKIKNAEIKEKEYKLFDSDGLYIRIKPSGKKLFYFRYKLNKKDRSMAFGSFPAVSLKEAREKRDRAKAKLLDGIDPMADRIERKRAEKTFKDLALEYFERRGEQSEKSDKRFLAMLNNDIFPHYGDKAAKLVNASDTLDAARICEKRGSLETARRVIQITGQIVRYGVSIQICARDFTPDIKGAIIAKPVKHHAAIIEPRKFGQLLRDIDQYNGSFQVRNALRLAPYLFLRPIELRNIEWREIDFDKKQIVFPAEKMKMRQPHIVPLCKQAMAIIEESHETLLSEMFVFPSLRSSTRAITDMSVLNALRNMGYDKDTHSMHGFRASARTMLDEQLGFSFDLIEHQLAHAVRDTNGRAYNRTSHLEKRREMMQAWGDYCDKLRKNK